MENLEDMLDLKKRFEMAKAAKEKSQFQDSLAGAANNLVNRPSYASIMLGRPSQKVDFSGFKGDAYEKPEDIADLYSKYQDAQKSRDNALDIKNLDVAAETTRAENANKRIETENEKNRQNAKDVAGIAAGNKSIDKKLAVSSDLRKEFQGLPEVKDIVTVQNAYNSIEAAANDPSPAGDLQLITSYMKVVDPGSTVREGEFLNAERAGSIPTQVVKTYNKMLRGERLTSEQRMDFVHQAQNLYSARLNNLNKQKDSYTSLAKRNEINPEDIFMRDFATPDKNPPQQNSKSKYHAMNDDEITKAYNIKFGGAKVR